MTYLNDLLVSQTDAKKPDAPTDLQRDGDQSIVSYRTSEGEPAADATDASHSGVSQANLQTTNESAPSLLTRFQTHIKTRIQDTLSDKRALASLLLLGSIVSLSAFGGYLIGHNAKQAQEMAILPASFSQGSGQKNSVAGVSDAQSALVDAEIARQMGDLRAELLRLHTVFVHLADLTELDDGEFDLESPLFDWQEQSSVQKLGLLNRRIAHMSNSGRTLKSIFDIRRMAYDQKISGKPLLEGHRTSGFGYRVDPINGERLEHLGLDYSGPVGEPILALADGIVTFSGKNSGYGNLVELEHIDGFRTRYAHNQSNLVSRGKRVKKGEAIATLGSTGRSTGPHVHVEVRLDGSPIDPGFFLR